MCDVGELESLEQKMKNVLVQDETYWRQNDAKFRAVAQNVTFEQFEEIGKENLSEHNFLYYSFNLSLFQAVVRIRILLLYLTIQITWTKAMK